MGVVDGGLKEISVKDDGSGVSPEDAPSLAKAHTTSKLESLEALPDVRTYGFRGTVALVLSLGTQHLTLFAGTRRGFA